MIKKDILNLENRRKIYNFIINYPGLHLRALSRKTNVSFSTLRHHLIYLDKHKIIMSKKEGKYIRYYPRNQISKKDKEILDFLRQDTPRAIILILFAYIECSLSEISKNLEKHPSTISYHLKNMKEMDIVEQVIVKNGIIQKKSIKLTIKRSQISNETVYMLKDPVSIYNLLVRYRYNLFDNVTIGCIVDYFNDFVAEGIPDKILSPKDSIDSIVKKINELFPPPFCA